MKFTRAAMIFTFLSLLIAGAAVSADSAALPIRGLHCGAPSHDDIPLCVRFIREALPKEGVNVLVLEINYNYQYTRHPEIAGPRVLSKEDIKQLAAACKEAGVRLIPQINCLGHQSWSRNTDVLLRAHPEFDETPGKYPENKGIYCRSYCPLHPQVHDVVFDLIDELAEACDADAFHVGMDEVFIIGDDDCPRCKGKSKADLFAQEVQTLHDHLAKSKRQMWMWGDRFLDGEATGVGEWEGAKNHTESAIDKVPKDIVICDWHYEKAVPTAEYFAMKGFGALACPWRKSDVALTMLEWCDEVRERSNETLAPRMLGVLQTTWTGVGEFIRAYNGEEPRRGKGALEAADCFKKLFTEVRNIGNRPESPKTETKKTEEVK